MNLLEGSMEDFIPAAPSFRLSAGTLLTEPSAAVRVKRTRSGPVQARYMMIHCPLRYEKIIIVVEPLVLNLLRASAVSLSD